MIITVLERGIIISKGWVRSEAVSNSPCRELRVVNFQTEEVLVLRRL